MNNNLKDANHAKHFCAPLTLSNTGKQATVLPNYAEYFRMNIHKVIQYPGKARDLVRYVFDETIVDAGGVRFSVKYEQCCRIATHGPKTIMKEVLPVYN